MSRFDLHNHILPGVDDGPPDIEQSVEMARMAYNDGTGVIVATPHNRDVAARSSLHAVIALVEELNRRLDALSIPVQVRLGMENHLEMDSPEQLDQGTAIPIDGTRFMLVELPFEFFPLYTEETLFRLQLKNLRLIIVHPERNARIQSNPELLADLVQKGAFAQVTAGSITGDFGKPAQKSARELLRQNLVHIIASDSHAPVGRRVPILSSGVAAAARFVGKEGAQRMVEEIPGAILQDRIPDTQGLVETTRRRWWPLGL